MANTNTKNKVSNNNEGDAAMTDTVTEVETSFEKEAEEINRIPSVLADNKILGEFCERYLEAFDEIAKYNKDVLTKSDDGWTQSKVLEKARELGRPADPKKTNEDVKKVLVAYENAVEALNVARKELIGKTSDELGITLNATSERNPEAEAPLKEKRKFALNIGTQLSMIAQMTSDANASNAVTEFLAKNPLPAVGRNQVSTFNESGKATPKYRVTVKVTKDGNILLEEDGFTKTAQALSKPVFGYERGQSPKSDVLRTAWEKAGNTPDNTVTNPVEFDDNGLHYVITKK